MDIDSTSYRSPNFDPSRSNGITILLGHATVGGLQSSLDWLCSPASRVSTHYLIAKDGRIFQLVNDEDTAWHAGKSKWGNETDVNDASLGIELENDNDGKDAYPVGQIAALTWLVEWKMHQYGIGGENIVRHLDVATPTGRKTDPADAVGFHWLTWKKSLTVGSDEQVWSLWGTQYPLYSDARHFGIPMAWFARAAVLGEARSGEIYGQSGSAVVFDHGIVYWSKVSNKTHIFMFNDLGAK